MNRDLVSRAISNINDTYIAEAMNTPAAKLNHAPERTSFMNTKHPVNSRRLVRVAIAACLIFALAVTAYAVYYYLGIRDMEQNLPVEVEPYIQEHAEAAVLEDWSARITESLCDESQILVTVTVSGGDRYIVAPTYADPNTPASDIGIEGSLTLGEYASQQGKELLFVGASLKGIDNMGGVGSQDFRNTSPNEMTILIQANKSGALTADEAVCHVYAVDGEWNKQTLDIPFSLQEAPAESSGVYVPDDADAVPGMRAGNATVTETPMGITIRFMQTVTSEDVWDNLKKVEFDGIVRGEGGWVLEDDGNWWLTVSRCTGEVGDTLTARYYDWDDQEIAAVVFRRQ